MGPFVPSPAASELAKLRGEPLAQELPEIDIDAVAAAHHAVRQGVRSGALSSAHDIAEGGLAVALAECCLAGRLGASIELESAAPAAETLFGEGPGGFIVSGAPEAIRSLSGRVSTRRIGTTGGAELRIELAGGGERTALALTLPELSAAHADGLAAYFA